MKTTRKEEVLSIVGSHSETDIIAIDIETTGLERSSEIVCTAISLSTEGSAIQSSFWLSRQHKESIQDQILFRELLRQTLFNPKYPGTLIFHNLDFDLRMLLQKYYEKPILLSKDLPKLMDTLTISRVLRNNKFVSHAHPEKLRCHSLKYLSDELLGESNSNFADVTNEGNIFFANQSKLLKYNERDAELTLKLYLKLKEILTPSEWRYIETIEMPHLLNLFLMNWHGVSYDALAAKNTTCDLENHANEIEREIYEELGRSLNIQSHVELSSALFYNKKLMYKNATQEDVFVRPLYITEQGRTKINIDTLQSIKSKIQRTDPTSKAANTIEKIIRLLEIRKSLAFIENHLSIVGGSTESNLHPNFSADAKSGRVKSSRPNLLGLPKSVFKKSDQDYIPENLQNASIRGLITAPEGYKIASIDISALDLSVVTHGALRFKPDFPWAQFFDATHDTDIHFMIAFLTNKKYFKKLFNETIEAPLDIENYWFTKPKEDGLRLTHKQTGENLLCKYNPNYPNAFEKISKTRNLFKVVNLSTSYLMGSKNMAINIQKQTGECIGGDEAQNLLDNFYKAFPEIREFQDYICNQVYHKGYAETVYGRKFYADCFDELNKHHRSSNSTYELVWFDGNDYWYIKARDWIKFQDDIIANLKVTIKPFGFVFKNILACEKLSRSIFTRRKRKISKKFNRQSEANMDNLGSFELSRVAISNEIDDTVKLGTSFTTEATALTERFIFEGNFLVPETGTVLFRVPLNEPSAKYFRYYVALNKVTRKFFPLYCQGFANSLAMQTLTQVRKTIETENLDARIFLFIHDQIEVLTSEKDAQRVNAILKESVESSKPPFNVRLTGKLESLSSQFK